MVDSWTHRHLYPGHPLILPIYLPSPAFNFIAMSSHGRSSSHLSPTASLGAIDQARASARLFVLAGVSWPFAWLLPCAGSAPRSRPFQLTCQLQGKLVVPKHGRCLRPCFPCISRFHDDRPGYGCTVTIWCSLMLYWLTRGVLRRVRFKQVWLRVLSNPT